MEYWLWLRTVEEVVVAVCLRSQMPPDWPMASMM